MLLREATGADLPGAAVAALAARTEGWGSGAISPAHFRESVALDAATMDSTSSRA